MMLHSRLKIGQSGQEFVLSVFFSFFLHAALVISALVFYTVVPPKAHVPPFYEVKLVGQPAETMPAPSQEPPPSAPKAEPAPPEEKPLPKAAKAAPRPAEKALNKDAIPELSQQKPKPAVKEEVKAQPAEQARPAPAQQAAVPATPSAVPAKAGSKSEGVEVKTSSGDFKFPPYLKIIKDNIAQNWNPPPGAKGMKVTILFKVLRSGKIEGVQIERSSEYEYFDRAARRAILELKSFPPMPDGFYKESAIFSVDLMPQE